MCSVQRVLVCSGKHYYALQKHRETLPEAVKNTAIVRVEELCPFPTEALQQELNKYTKAKGAIESCFHNVTGIIVRLHVSLVS